MIGNALRELSSRALGIIQETIAHAVVRVVGGRNAMPFVVFPRSLTGIETGDKVPANPAAPMCGASSGDTSSWIDVAAAVPTTRINSLRLRVPPGFLAAEYKNVTEGKAPHWDHILGTWYVERELNSSVEPPSVTFWIGPNAGYPRIGMPPGTRQLSFTECQDVVDGTHVHIATFSLRPSNGRTSYQVAAFWRIASDVHIAAAGNGPTLEAQEQIAAIIRSVRIA